MKLQNADENSRDCELITVPVVPPRDPTCYRKTKHYINRLRERVSEAYQATLPANLIREGRVHRLKSPDAESIIDDEMEHGAKVAFTTTGPKKRPWTLIVGLRPNAFTVTDEKHRAITIFQGTPNQVAA